ALLPDFRSHFDLALALRVLAEGDDAVDLADDRELLRLPSLEELRDPRQTAGDVLGLGRLARHLRQHVARHHLLAVDDVDVDADWELVASFLPARQLDRLAVRPLDRDARRELAGG